MTIVNGATIDASEFKGNPAPFFSIEGTVGSSHSLTTIANQKVMVIAKGAFTGSTALNTVSLQYNGVTKDSVTIRSNSSSSNYTPFTLTYTEIPGADTKNITFVTGSGSLSDLSITVIKLQVG